MLHLYFDSEVSGTNRHRKNGGAERGGVNDQEEADEEPVKWTGHVERREGEGQ